MGNGAVPTITTDKAQFGSNVLMEINYNAEYLTVSARDLHEKLNIGTKFTTWFERMCEYGFTEGNEFFPKLGETSERGGRPSVDYEISIDMAKEICMIQRTPEGKTLRQYFIDLEKAWNTPEQIMARALKLADKKIEDLKSQNDFLIKDIDEDTWNRMIILMKEEQKARRIQNVLRNKIQKYLHYIYTIFKYHNVISFLNSYSGGCDMGV